MTTIDYFYSVRSVYAYLGAARVTALARRFGRRLVHRPVDLGRVVVAFGSQPFADRSSKHKELYFGRELERWSEFLGVPLVVDPEHHFGDRLLPSGAILAAQRQGLDADALSRAILQALWRDDRDIADAAVLTALCRELGIDPERVVAQATAAFAVAEFERCTEEAIAKGVPGSPTYIVDGELFYGQDRLALVERALQRPFARTTRSGLSW
jgi:2-hydroxychromene-2-carboxylate isomerase